MVTIDTRLAPAICGGRTFEIREPLRDLFAPPQEWVDTLQLNMYVSSHNEGVIVVFDGATFKIHHYAYHYNYNRVHKMLSRLDAYARAVLLFIYHQEV